MIKNKIIGLKVLPGEPTNGSGKICIHLFVVTKENGGKGIFRAVSGHLACSPKKSSEVTERKGVTNVTMHTDDPRAATCPACIKSSDYTRIMKLLE